VLNEIVWKESMTLQSLKFFSLYLSRINASDPENTRVVRFSVKEFARVMGFKGDFNRDHYKKTVNRLLSHIVHIDYANGEMDSFALFTESLLRQDKTSGEWYIEMEAHKRALPLMFDFKERYFTYELWNVLHLKSFNHLRMYEVLKQYEKAGQRTIKLEVLKKFLGIAPTEYSRWWDFQKKVLISCQKILAEKTDIVFNYEPIRNGRGGKVIGIKFTIVRNPASIQLTFDDFIGQADNFQLTFDDVEPVVLADERTPSKPKATRKRKKIIAYTPEQQAILKEYDEVCKNEFTEKQILELYEIIHNRIKEKHRVDGGYMKEYLREAYVILLENERKEVINSRFAYLKQILQNILEQRTLEKK
jgi:plasmid replication initiation protein